MSIFIGSLVCCLFNWKLNVILQGCHSFVVGRYKFNNNCLICKDLLPDKFADHGFIGTSVTFWSLNVSTMVVVLLVGRCEVQN